MSCYHSSGVKELEKLLRDQPKTYFSSMFRNRCYRGKMCLSNMKDPGTAVFFRHGSLRWQKVPPGTEGLQRFRQWSSCPCDPYPRLSGLVEILNVLHIIFILTSLILFFLVTWLSKLVRK